MRLVGRADERRVLDELVEAVRAERSQALVLLGEPGIGKSALLGHLLERASGLQVLRLVGIEAEMELPYAGLHQLFGAMTERIDALPGPQRRALRGAFGLEDGAVPDRYMIALGVLNLLADLSEKRPLLCLVDDAQWLDSATVLALSFVARRLGAEAVGLVFASRGSGQDLQGLPTITIAGLSTNHAFELLDSVLTGPLDPSVRKQIVVETRGNPLALLELPRGVSPARLAGGFSLPGVVSLPERIAVSYQRRLDPLSLDARQFLLLAAADPVGDPIMLWAAASRVGLGPAAVTTALASGLVEIGARVTFCHPLARSAIYGSADLVQHRAVHEVLASVTDPDADPDRRAWHRARAAAGPDEEIAAELERSAGRARSRGGVSASAAFLERAATLTADPDCRVRRLIAAADAIRDAGAPDAALDLLETAGVGSRDDEHTARIMRTRGLIAAERHRREEAVDLLLGAARRFDEPEASESLLAALVTAIYDAKPADPLLVRVTASIAEIVGGPADPSTFAGLLLHGLHLRVTEGYEAAAPFLRRAVDALVAAAPSERWSALGTSRLMLMLPGEMWDAEAWGLLVTQQANAARRDGALVVLPAALHFAAFHRIFEGDLLGAQVMLDELGSIAAATGVRPNAHTEAVLSAWRGDEARARDLSGQVRQQIAEGRGALGFFVDYADAVLDNALGQFDAALATAQKVFDADQIPMGPMLVSELIDAASRTGSVQVLHDARDWLAERVTATPNSWVLGVNERVQALLAEDDFAESHYVASIKHLSRTSGRLEVARSHLLAGEWFRRKARRGDARRHLREAHRIFQASGAHGFALRAMRELRATGDATVRVVEVRHTDLTPQEAQIAALAAKGLTNPEIGVRLFISRRTVQYHLSKVFLKLDITSRAQLRQALRQGAGD